LFKEKGRTAMGLPLVFYHLPFLFPNIRCWEAVKKTKLPDLYEKTGTEVLREIKWLPKSYVFDGVVCIFDNKVAYISSRQESFGFVVESKEFAQIMRLIFESSWAMVP